MFSAACFLLNLEQLSDAALPPERTLSSCCCCVRTRGECQLREAPQTGFTLRQLQAIVTPVMEGCDAEGRVDVM